MRRTCPLIAALAMAACGNPTSDLCGDGEAPEVVTGLNGVLEGGGPALEVQYRVPDTCEVLDARWIFFDDPTQALSIGDEPSEGRLGRDRVQVEEREVFFTDFAVTALLVYPDDVVGSELTLVWVTASGEALGEVACVGDAEAEALTCTLTDP